MNHNVKLAAQAAIQVFEYALRLPEPTNKTRGFKIA
jgi:hypothetical protein